MQTWKERNPTVKNHRSAEIDLQISKINKQKKKNANRNIVQTRKWKHTLFNKLRNEGELKVEIKRVLKIPIYIRIFEKCAKFVIWGKYFVGKMLCLFLQWLVFQSCGSQ